MKLDVKQAINILRNFLIMELNGKVTNNNWISFKGDRFCSECRSHKRSALYMYLSPNSPVYLKCFRASCDLRRACTAQDLINLGFKNMDAIKVLMNLNENSSFTTYKNIEGEFSLNDMIMVTTRFNTSQEDYFYKRCLFIPTNEDMKRFRLIPNIREFIYDNFEYTESEPCRASKITSKNKEAMESFLKNYRKFFSNNFNDYISYFTDNGEKIFFRAIDDNVHGIPKGQLSITDNKSMYTVTRGDKVENIIVTEGIFDLFNIYTYFNKENNSVYSATGGFAAFEYTIINLYKKNIDTVKNLYIYCDSDVHDTKIDRYFINEIAINNLLKRLFRKISTLAFEKVYLINNSKSKDFGDMSLPIRERRYLVDLNNINTPRGSMKLIPLN